MKRILPACLLVCILSGASRAAIIWQEDFSGYTNAGVTGQGPLNYAASITNWSINVSACTTLTPGSGNTNDYFMAVATSGGRMEAAHVVGEAIWSSAVISISSYTNVSLSVATSETGTSANTNKYVKLFYRLSGGAETAFAINPFSIGNWTNATATQSNLCGSTVQIIARVNNPNSGDRSIFDTVVVSGEAFNMPPVLNAIGNKSVFEGKQLSFSVTASDPIDGDPITLSATNLPTGAAFTNGLFSWSTAVPAGAYNVTFFATDKDGSDSEAVTITVSPLPQLILSEIADPAGTGGDVYRFVELYNAGTNAINLASNGWTLCRQNNGTDWTDISLTGTVAAAGSYVVAKGTNFYTTYGLQPQQISSGADGNGNDVYALYCGGNHTNGTLIDVYGQIDIDGTGAAWEYSDSRVVRQNNILQPNDVWTAAEWTITPNAATSDMTPGRHGPAPEFQGLENQFVFLGDSLSFTVTAINTVRTDVITLSAATLPGSATFAPAAGTNTVSSTFNWTSPPAGTYTGIFITAGSAGAATTSVVITVSSSSRITGYFYGWNVDSIFKLDNGQFWQQSDSSSKSFPKIYHPIVTITNYLSYERRMYITNSTSYVVVRPLDVTESTVTNSFAGLHYQNIYLLADGTSWRQISFENSSSNAVSVKAWRWISGGVQKLRFLAADNTLIGTCTVEASTPPTDTTIRSKINGWFRGWQSKRVFVLTNGEFWQQTSLDSSSQTIYSPAVTITNYLQTGLWRMSIDGQSGYISVQQLTNVTHTTVNRWFYGFGRGSIFSLADGSWWKQTSSESSASIRFLPEVLIWNENGTDYLEMPDEGHRVAAEQLDVQFESSVTNAFTGLHYNNLYRLDGDGDWIQLSFENVSANVASPTVMLWKDGAQTNMIVRDKNDVTIGTCVVIDPIIDSDADGINNQREVIAGSDPFNAQSKFKITQADHYILSWNAVEGRVYTIEWTPSLTESFQTLESSITWPQSSWTDTVHTVQTKGFYRITVRLAD